MMATVKPRTHKDGSISYEIRVSLGRDINGKQIMKYHTWEPPKGMTPRLIEKALEREKVLFEEKCRNGYVLDTSTKFADFANNWLEANRNTHSPAYQKRAHDLLIRINASIGHIPLGKIRPHHLQEFYKNLGEAGVKKSSTIAVARGDLSGILKEKNITRTGLAKAAEVAPVTITTACQGKNISGESAKKIAQGLNVEVDTLFTMDSKKEPLSTKTILHHHRLISSILETAVKWQVIYDNPARRVEPPKVQKKEASYLDNEEALRVVEALVAAPLKWRTIIMLLMHSGMRRGEACGLTWDDLDFDNRLVHIIKANQYLSGQGIFEKDTKNESSKRVIKLPAEMFAMLREYKGWQAEERLKMGDRWQDSGKIFTQENGLPMHPDSITGWVAEFRETHNLPHFTPHSLRHTSATLLIMQGVPVKAVSARLGHANQNTTNVVYSHAIKTVDAMASDVIGEVLKTGDSKASNLTKTSQPN